MYVDLLIYALAAILVVMVAAVAHRRRNITIGLLGLSITACGHSLAIWSLGNPSLSWIACQTLMASTVGLITGLWFLFNTLMASLAHPSGTPLQAQKNKPMKIWMWGKVAGMSISTLLFAWVMTSMPRACDFGRAPPPVINDDGVSKF